MAALCTRLKWPSRALDYYCPITVLPRLAAFHEGMGYAGPVAELYYTFGGRPLVQPGCRTKGA